MELGYLYQTLERKKQISPKDMKVRKGKFSMAQK